MTDGRDGTTVPRPALLLGFAGLLPPLAGLWLLVLSGGGMPAAAVFTAIFVYSALIFSFVGGAWWGLASASGRTPGWQDLLLAVTPSLAAFLCLPLVGDAGPAGALPLAVLILLSPAMDLRFVRAGLAPAWWMRLRVPLSIGLSTLLGGAIWLAG